ncbi:hypothetical protein R6V09_38335 [Streptomyces sp. W16]|uniref:hypothetical protein n=1 Tax=Streptomyces sp. W16 TaxID=3076631 RepID=UPI00295B73FD|nr:hypothetical protein [Streptomyces sp. W16]MDV9175966.1 hypothetical protein [Streptomyces sp. W16]
MRLFTRRTKASPEAETAMRTAEKSLRDAQARTPEVEAKLTESHRVKEQLQAHNRACPYGDLVESIVIGRLTDR